MEEKSENRKKKEFLIDNLKSLLQECKKLEKQLAGANYSRRTKFYAWIRKRQKLELIEDECHAMNLDAFDKIDLKKIVAYSSVVHMSFSLLGLFSYNTFGIKGFLFLLFKQINCKPKY